MRRMASPDSGMRGPLLKDSKTIVGAPTGCDRALLLQGSPEYSTQLPRREESPMLPEVNGLNWGNLPPTLILLPVPDPLKKRRTTQPRSTASMSLDVVSGGSNVAQQSHCRVLMCDRCYRHVCRPKQHQFFHREFE